MKWHVRVSYKTNDYGRWIPTGCSDLDEAKEYMAIYYRTSGVIVEWLQL